MVGGVATGITTSSWPVIFVESVSLGWVHSHQVLRRERMAMTPGIAWKAAGSSGAMTLPLATYHDHQVLVEFRRSRFDE